ncbi:MAG TPA: two-component regulator propeller domain-containing protein [Bacteroidales bacterium]|nr:two-component regulator propeller domain-containing protein [Bacteroidales bacterium]
MRKTLFSTLVCIVFFTGLSSGQVFRFRNFGAENNLPSRVIYTISQSPDGYLWVGTTEGLARFDGFRFYPVVFPDSVSGRYPTASFTDSRGDTWFGCNDGTVFYLKKRSLRQVSLSNSSAVSAFFEDQGGFVYAVAQRKSVFRINPGKIDEVKEIHVMSDPVMLSACLDPSGELLLGTQENLLVCRITADSILIRDRIEGFDYSSIVTVNKLKGTQDFIIGTDGNGIFHLTKSAGGEYSISRFSGYPELEMLTVKNAMTDTDGNMWLSTSGSGAVKLVFSGPDGSMPGVQFFSRSSGLAGDNVSVIFQDAEKNIWLGFNGDGLSMLNNEAFQFFAPGKERDPKSIIHIGRSGSNYLLGTPAGFYTFNPPDGEAGPFVPFTGLSGKVEIASFFEDDENNIWIGTKGDGLYKRNSAGKTDRFFRSGDSGSDYIANICVAGENIWLSTLNGVIIVSKRTGTIKKTYNINTGLPHNSINQILVADDGSGYVATESDRLYRIDPDEGISSSGVPMYGRLLNKIISLARDKENNIWAATLGNGVFRCTPDSVQGISTSNGLLSNYAYSILSDREDQVWIGHERGFSVYSPGIGTTRTYTTDFAKGGSCNPNAIYESADGKIFIGTTEGLVMYDRSKDRKKETAPVNNINYIVINDVEYQYQPVFSFPYRKRYNIRINYTGISFSNPEEVYYSTFMKNYDDDWSPVSRTREASYSLRDGKYTFNLVSVNEDGLGQSDPLSFEINIKPPFWRAWWFVLSVTALVAGILIVIVRQREKAQKKIQEYLENELAARTRVVIKQKEEIELQNLEITDSINYARRIQSSILPDINKLREHFREAFIILQPRDIVSGDFYWFDKFDDERFILVCADSTGHGVPGAFMSMIGSTLLQDIVLRQRISRPSEILAMLDRQVFSTLNQNLETGVSNDGMDIVVCEFSLKNKYIRFASAMRPVIIVMGGEICYIKGNRSSVGGQSVLEKYFDDHEYYLNEGDTIYMFSDGLPDQFGGPEGKKMKIARLKNLLGEIWSLPVKEQEERLLKFYHDWKGDLDQVDDILFMGVKI